MGDQGAADLFDAVHAVAGQLAHMGFDVLDADLVHQAQALAQGDGAGVVGGAADLKAPGGHGEGPVVHGRRGGILPVGAPAALGDGGVQVAGVALLELGQGLLVHIQHAGAVGGVQPFVAAGGEDVDVAGLGVDLGHAQLLHRVHHQVDAALLAEVADLLHVALPAVAPLQGGHHQHAGLVVHQGLEGGGGEALVGGLAHADVDVLLLADDAPGQGHLDELQVGGHDVVAVVQLDALGGDVQAVGGALHEGDLIEVGVQQLCGLHISLVALVVQRDVVGAGVGLVLAGGHVGKLLDGAHGALGRKADAGGVQKGHGFQNGPFFFSQFLPIVTHCSLPPFFIV